MAKRKKNKKRRKGAGKRRKGPVKWIAYVKKNQRANETYKDALIRLGRK